MTSEELLKPRFKVVADYPNPKNHCYYKVGEIINTITEEDISYCLKYPHLFKKLNWWEFRNIEDMPKKLHCRVLKDNENIYNHEEVFNIVEWDMKNLIGWTNNNKREGCDLTLYLPEYGYFPVD